MKRTRVDAVIGAAMMAFTVLYVLAHQRVYAVTTVRERELGDVEADGTQPHELNYQDRRLIDEAIEKGFAAGEPSILAEQRSHPGMYQPGAATVIERDDERYLLVSQLSRTRALVALSPWSRYKISLSETLRHY